jgi:hypothetical protein
MKSTPILLAGDASFLITQTNPRKFKHIINEVYNVTDDGSKKT